MTFDEMFYLQIHGISMGTMFAPTFATLFTCFHEIEPYVIIRDKFTLPVFSQTKLGKIFKWLFHVFKIKFNKGKWVAWCFKQYQHSYTIYYWKKWYLAPILWYHDK